MYTYLSKLIYKIHYQAKRHPFLHFFRCILITKEPKKCLFDNETINKYNQPKHIPLTFKEELKYINFIEQEDSFTKAIKIANYIKSNYTGGRGLGYASWETLEIMKAKRGGVCSDYSQIMINFCILCNIPIREWNLSEKLFGKFGHVYNEIYSEKWAKWILLDVSKHLYFIHNVTNEPLSVIEFVDLMTSGKSSWISTINTFTNKEDIDIYNNPTIQKAYFVPKNLFFMTTKYNIKWFDRILRYRKYMPLPVLHFVLIGIGKYYHYIFYVNKNNAQDVRNEMKQIWRKEYAKEFFTS